MILPRPCNLGLPHVSEMAGLSSHVVPADMRCAARLTIRVAPPMSCPSICLPRVEKPACLAKTKQLHVSRRLFNPCFPKKESPDQSAILP